MSLVAGIIAGVAALLGGGISALSAKRQQDRANRYNKAQTDLAYQRELEQQQYQNDYNSPANQRRLLEEAGYNANYTDASALSADAAAPSPIPYQTADYSNSINTMTGSITEGINQMYKVMQMNEQLKYQRLLNEDKDNDINRSTADYHTDFALNRWKKSRDLYNQMIADGVAKEDAQLIIRNYIANSWVPGTEYNKRPYVSGEYPITDSWFDFFGEKGQIMYNILKANEKNSKYAAEQKKREYEFYDQTFNQRVQQIGLQNWSLSSNTYEMGQKASYAKTVANYINSQKDLSPLAKSTAIIAANSFIFNGADSGANPLNYINPIGFAKSIINRPRKSDTYNFNNYKSWNNFKSEKTNIINPQGQQ